MKVEPTQFNNVGNVLKSPVEVPAATAQSGIPVSDLFPHVADVRRRPGDHPVDGLELLRAHQRQLLPAHRLAACRAGRAWAPGSTYGLGSESRNLPGFVVLNGGLIPPGGLDNFNSGFLPAAYQGSVFQRRRPAGRQHHARRSRRRAAAAASSTCCASSTRACSAASGQHDELESAIANYETGLPHADRRARADGPRRASRRRRSELYGLDDAYADTRIFGRQCLIARRLVERGVRFVELLCPNVGDDRWDQHGDLKDGHENNARAVDQPIAGLLKDLKARGLLDETLVVWAGEFGRTPIAQGTDGRDHNPYGFTVWLAGGGVKGGTIYGATDEYGYHAVEDKVEIHDLHATMLHLLGIDHKRLTYRFGGRDMRLTDVHGRTWSKRSSPDPAGSMGVPPMNSKVAWATSP